MRNGCEYCRQDEDGGKDILEIGVSCGEFGTLKTGVTFNTYDEPHMFLAAWLDMPEKGHSIVIGREDAIFPKYCFNCGRKL